MSGIKRCENFWEAVQFVNGQVFVFRGGFVEDALATDIFKIEVVAKQDGSANYQCSRFDFNPITPMSNVKFNPSSIICTWEVPNDSSIVLLLKRTIQEMDAKKAGIILPNTGG